jgi:hypothetical protein
MDWLCMAEAQSIHGFRSLLMKLRPERKLQQTTWCIYSILWMWRKLHWWNRQTSSRTTSKTQAQSQRGSYRKIKISPTCPWRGHTVGWVEACILEIENISKYRKCKDSAHMACLTSLISQPTSYISPIWIPLISNEVGNSQGRSVWSDRFFMGFYNALVPNVQFLVHTWH